jgi:hypothetical protein
MVLQDAYFGHMVKKIVFKHQTIDLAYLRSQPIMSELVDRFEHMGLANFLQHRCYWNETVIRQFYANIEISMEEEKIWWKTGKRVYYATFAQFAAANQLDYDLMKNVQTVILCWKILYLKLIILSIMSLLMSRLLECLGALKVLGIILLS